MSRIGITGGGLGLGRGMGPRLTGGGGEADSLDADAVTLIAAMTTEPDATRQTLISDTIAALKTAGVWDELDECWFMAAATEQAGLLGWKRLKDCVAVNAPTFTADQGFAGNGTTSYLNTQFVPSTDGVQYTQDDASLGVYSRTDSDGAMVDISTRVVADNNAYVQIRSSGNQICRVNSGGSTNTTTAAANSLGLACARRTSSTDVDNLRNGAVIGSGSFASVLRSSAPIIIGAFQGEPVQSFSTRQYAFAFVAASMTPTQQASLFTIVESYMDAISAGVVA